MRQPTQVQRDAAKARRDKFRALVRQVAAMTEEQKDELVRGIGAIPTCEGRSLSAINSRLVLIQTGGKARMVGGFNQWRKAGRTVRKGEHGHSIWIPTLGSVSSEPDADAPDVRFIVGTVFDISQTEPIDIQQSEAA